MTTIRQQRTATFFTALNTSRPAGVPAFRRALTNADIDANASPDQLPDAVLTKLHDGIPEKTRDVGEARQSRASGLGGLEYRQLRLGLLLWFAGTSTVPPDDTPEPTLAWIKKAARTLKVTGLVHRAVVEEIGFTISTDGQVPRCRVTGVVVFDYQCRADDDEQWA